MKATMSDRTFELVNHVLLLLFIGMILFPLLFVLSASVSDPTLVNSGKVWIWPRGITFEGYKRIFQNNEIWLGYLNTIVYTVIGTVLHLIVLLPCAYALSRRELAGKKLILWYFLLTMMIGGGLIPTYLVVRDLGMVNSMWAIVIPGVVGAWDILVSRTFFQQNVPDPLVEAAKVDGSSYFHIFFRIALPLSLPIIAVMSLFHGVGLWNQYFNALIYLNHDSLYPLQLVLRKILVAQEMSSENMANSSIQAEALAAQARIASILKYGVIVVSTAPLLAVYPFLQRFFLKGVLIGSIKE
ncbi:carbohydrate ABC transporter permease [Paenibacillus cisolokensis]|jgi:putative aldouronate transport system permease protein|uniref:carbohydrate ABC transporter permease n=1 Tax=Paenibacillus TaxID=44249 RepID=UPI0007228D85|nr:carbohydrate ABC transporter permease [Paenibacillus sp. 32O-W]ALS30025.1 sugar ABC transporter permease [Paenibacillus sp. 32O-W]